MAFTEHTPRHVLIESGYVHKCVVKQLEELCSERNMKLTFFDPPAADEIIRWFRKMALKTFLRVSDLYEDGEFIEPHHLRDGKPLHTNEPLQQRTEWVQNPEDGDEFVDWG